MTKSNFVTKLYDLRKINDFSQAFVASKIGIDVNEYMNLENGNIPYTTSYVNKLATLYKVKYEQLVNDELEVDYVKLNMEDSIVFQQKQINKKYNPKQLKLIVLILVILFGSILFLIFFNSNQSLAIPNPNRVSCSNNTVAYIDNYGKLFKQGLNEDTFNYQISKVCENDTNTLVLKNDNTVSIINELDYSDELSDYDKVSDIALGTDHILLIDNNKVVCLGDNSQNQCEVSDWKDVSKIYAYKDESIGISKTNTIFASGNIIDENDINDITDAQDIAVSDKIVVYLNQDNQVIALNSVAKEFDLSNFNNVKKVVCGSDFIAALKYDNTVVIAIEDYLIKEAVSQWSNIIDIAASDNSLVAYDGSNVYGIGDNEYNQFIKTNVSESTQLPSVSNININIDKNYVKITWDKVNNVVCYSVDINTGTGYSTKVTNNYVLVDTSKFTNNQEYYVRIVSIGDNINYTNSSLAEKIFQYLDYVEPTVEPTSTPSATSEEITIPTTVTLETLTGKLKFNFLAYMSGLGVPDENLSGSVDENSICENNKEIILTVTGITDGEEINLEDLQSTKITYTYCLVSDSPLPTDTSKETSTTQNHN